MRQPKRLKFIRVVRPPKPILELSPLCSGLQELRRALWLARRAVASFFYELKLMAERLAAELSWQAALEQERRQRRLQWLYGSGFILNPAPLNLIQICY